MKSNSRNISANIFVNVGLQVVTILCGLIVPRLIIGFYGSEINGILTSITQFLGYITLLEAGMGSVVKASLYKPLANKDSKTLSGIVKATNSFFRKIAYIFIAYLLLLSVFYQKISGTSQEWFFTFSLVLIMGFSTFVQYFFGITYQILLQADQKIWLTSGLQIVTLILNTIFTVILVNLGCSIHVVKISTALIFTIRPVVYRIYINKKYRIDWSVPADKESISQRWDGLGHHIAYFIHTNTDVVLLTIFCGVTEVSVYSVYFMVVNGVKSLVNSIASAIEPFFGRLLTGNDKDKINKAFSLYESINYLLVTIIFTSTAVLILPFVKVYTKGIVDANYYRPLFAIIITAAEGAYSLRNPYSSIIFASGHFKQTRNGAIVEAIVNIVISLILIKPLGIIGVAIGTLVSMLLRSIQYIWYLKSNILERPFCVAMRKMIIMFVAIALSAAAALKIEFQINSYFQWIFLALIRTTIIALISMIVFSVAYHKDIRSYIHQQRKGIEQ